MAGRDRLIVDQALCDKVGKLTIRGLEPKEIVDILGISQATVSRIQAANFDLEQFKTNNEKRRQAEKQKKEKPAEEESTDPGRAEHLAMQANEQVQGQIEMELPEKAKEKMLRQALIEGDHIIYPDETTSREAEDQKKLYRFLAGQFDETQIAICLNLGKIYDMLGQILRAIRKE